MEEAAAADSKPERAFKLAWSGPTLGLTGEWVQAQSWGTPLAGRLALPAGSHGISAGAVRPSRLLCAFPGLRRQEPSLQRSSALPGGGRACLQARGGGSAQHGVVQVETRHTAKLLI